MGARHRAGVAIRLRRPGETPGGRWAAAALLAFSLAASWCLAAVGRAEANEDDGAARAALQRAAESEGAAYAVARELLARQGEALVPLLKEEARSPDWRRWSLAEWLLLRIDKPEQAARWRWALRHWQGRLAAEEPGTCVLRFEAEAIERAKNDGVRLDGEMRFGREAVPAILDAMREYADDAGRGSTPAEGLFERAAAALEHLAEPRLVEPMIHFSTVRGWQREAAVIEALARLGLAALPALHEAVRRGDGDWHSVRRADLAVRALGAIGDRSSAPVLVETLDHLTRVESIPIYCRAIRRIGPDDGPEILFSQLLEAGAGWPGRKFPRSGGADDRPWDRVTRFSHVYAAIRAELLALGPAVEEMLARRKEPDPTVLRRAITAGVAYELGRREPMKAFYEQLGSVVAASEAWARVRPDEGEIDLAAFGYERFWSGYGWSDWTPPDANVPAALRIEQAAVWPDERRLRALGDLKGDRLASEVLEWVLVEEPHARRQQPAAILALAEMGGAKAVDVYRRRLERYPLLDVETIVEAVILVGDPRGAEVLNVIVNREGTTPALSQPAYRTAAEAARAVLPLLKDGAERLVELLETESPSLRLAAARSLASRGDLRAAPVLFEAALAAAPEAVPDGARPPSEDQPAAHRRARDALVALGEPAMAALREAAARSQAPRAALLAEAVTLRVRRPELVERFRQAGMLRSPGFASRPGPSVDDFRITGRRAAELLGAEAVPLLESAIVWRADGILPGVAAFALAQFRQDRSIGILVAHAPAIGGARGGGLAAAALHEFGEKGVAAARDVPEADPERPGFDRRVARHRAAAETLTLAEDEQGIDAILAGLRLAAAGEIDAARTNVYLRLAAKTPDERLVPVVVAVVERHGGEVAGRALEVLVPTADPRILPVCMKFLGDDDVGLRCAALRGVAAVKGEQTPEFLLERLDGAKEPAERSGIARALAELRSASTLPLHGTGVSQEVLDRHAPRVRRALLGLLDDAEVQTTAAEALAQFLSGRQDDEAVAALIAWLRRRPKPDQSDRSADFTVLEYVVSTRAAVVAPALLAMYRDDPLNRAHLAQRLATLQHAEAIDDVRAALDERLTAAQTRWGIPEIDVLTRLGPGGRDALMAATEKHASLPFRVEALAGLTLAGHQPAFAPTARLFDELVANGLRDPRIEPQGDRSRSEAYAGAMATLARALLQADGAAAYPRVARACLDVNVPPAVRDLLAGQVRELLRQRPELADLEVALPAEPFADVAGDLPELPLLVAAGAWLEAVERRGSDGPPDEVRDRVLAGGVDSLQIGIELFYPWPTPRREDVAAALADLTAHDAQRRRRAGALLAVRAYPVSFLDDALSAAEGETFRRGLAIRRWRREGGGILDADRRLRGAFTVWMLRDWPIDQMRRFTLAELERLAMIEREEYMWSEKPLYPLLASLHYSPDPRDRERLSAFAAEARGAAAEVARHVLANGVQGYVGPGWTGLGERWRQ